MRQEFALPEEDQEHLDRLGLEWETVREGGGHWLLLHKFEFPAGLNHSEGSVAIQIPNNYPVAQLDMAYFFPHLARTDNQPIRQADVRQPIDGKSWQRWSRHYTWVAGVHNIGTHVVLIRHWLNAALGKG